MKAHLRLEAAKNTRLGRFLCRLAGDESRSRLMEYVILRVLIAAAVVPAAIYFGKEITRIFTVMRPPPGTEIMSHVPPGPHPAIAATTSEDDRKALSRGAGNNVANK